MKFYAWFVRHQDTISGFVSGVCLMSAVDQFLCGNNSTGSLYLLVSVVNLLLTKQRLEPKE
jgi:hypothetical protein